MELLPGDLRAARRPVSEPGHPAADVPAVQGHPDRDPAVIEGAPAVKLRSMNTDEEAELVRVLAGSLTHSTMVAALATGRRRR